MKVIKAVSLFFQEGTSDKVYNATLVEEGPGLYTVRVEWGRRGSPLAKGAKAVKVPLDKAEREMAKVLREKTGKGYQEIAGDVKPAKVAPPVGQGSAARVAKTGRARTGVAAQLLNAIDDERTLEKLLADGRVVAQQKLDGERVLVHIAETCVATNRAGQVKKIHAAVIETLAAVAPEGTIVDGELVGGDTYWLFDLLQHGATDLRKKGYLYRYEKLRALAEELADPIRVVPLAETEEEKRRLHDELAAANAEGIVFKRIDAPYVQGRPASGGAQLKYKFVKSADVFLTANAGNAYQMAVYDGKKIREVGKVFAGTTNASRKKIDALISSGKLPVAEVRYLYATDDLILFQPVFAALRDDKMPKQCTVSQLVRTNREVRE